MSKYRPVFLSKTRDVLFMEGSYHSQWLCEFDLTSKIILKKRRLERIEVESLLRFLHGPHYQINLSESRQVHSLLVNLQAARSLDDVAG